MINWKIRFNKDNKVFLGRFAIAVLLPLLAYFNLNASDLTTWGELGKVFIGAISNPYVLGFTVINAVNVLSDPTTNGFGDSERALGYQVISKD